MQDLGVRLADLLRPGDLVIASGDLGAGKTTLTQGIGRGLDSEGAVISPTFVLSRIHPSRSQRPALVHVDAYRLTSAEELDDLDLDATAGDAVTVVEWGAGLAEGLADHRLEIDIRRSAHPDRRRRAPRQSAGHPAPGGRALVGRRPERPEGRESTMPEAADRTVVLGVDTATVVCVGLAIDGTAVATAQVDDRMAHVEQLTPLIRRVCADAGVAPTELTDVVVGLGPGPYTGLRVGIVTARVLAEIAGARLHGICSLDVIAAQYATTAARRGVRGRHRRPAQGGLLGPGTPPTAPASTVPR